MADAGDPDGGLDVIVDGGGDDADADTGDDGSVTCAPEWMTFTVDAAEHTGASSALAVDASRGVHVSYLENGSVDLRYAYLSAGGDWATTTVDGDGFTGYETSIAVDATGAVHVSYYDGTNDALRYARLTAGEWTSTTIDDDGNVGLNTSLVVDGEGNVHVAYRGRGTGEGSLESELRYAYRPLDGDWSIETVDNTTTSTGFDPALAVDGAGGVHIGYNESGHSGDLRYAFRMPGGGWMRETLNTGATGDSAIAISPSGRIFLCYGEFVPSRMICLSKMAGDAWIDEVVDEHTGLSGPHTSLVVDGSETVHLSYYDTYNDGRGGGRLRYASRPAGGMWARRTIDDSVTDTGKYCSLAVDSAGAVHVSYQDATNRDLRYARLLPCP